MKIDLTIPGYISETELTWLAERASEVPEGGTILELGSLLGRSTYALAANTKPDVTVYALDMFFDQNRPHGFWNPTQWVFITPEQLELFKHQQAVVEELCGDGFLLPAFHHFTKGLDNIRPISAMTYDIMWKKPKVDMLFIDTYNCLQGIVYDVSVWSQVVKDGGILCGHDYFDGLYDAVRIIDSYCAMHGWKVNVHDTIWWVQKPITGA